MRHYWDTRIHTVIMLGRLDRQSSRQDGSLEISFAEREQLDLTGRVRIRKCTKGKHWLHPLSAHSYGCTKINTHQLLIGCWKCTGAGDQSITPVKCEHVSAALCVRWLLAEHLDKESNTVRVYFFPGWGNFRAALKLMWEPGICPQWHTGWGDGAASVPAPRSVVMGAQVCHLHCLVSFVHRAGKREGADSPQGLAPTSALSAALAEWPGLRRSPAWRWVTAPLSWEQERDWQQAWELGPSHGVHVKNLILIPSSDCRGRSSDRRQGVSPSTHGAWASTPQVEVGGPEEEHGGKNRPLNMMEHHLKTCTCWLGPVPQHLLTCHTINTPADVCISRATFFHLIYSPSTCNFFSFFLWSWHYFKTYNLYFFSFPPI